MQQKFTALLTLLIACFGFSAAWAQSPVCVIDSITPSAPGLYPNSLPNAQGCVYYETDITFLLPRDTVYNGVLVHFNTFTINSITGMPPGINWQCNHFANGCVYDVSQGNANPDTFGCVRLYGVPIQIGTTNTYTGTITVTATTDNILQPSVTVTFNRDLTVSPCVAPANCFTYNQNAYCEPVTISGLQPIPSLQSNGQSGYTYTWTMGSVFSSNDQFPQNPPQLHYGGDSILSLTVNIDTIGFILDTIKVVQINCTDGIGGGQPDLYWGLFQGATSLIPLTSPVSGGPAIPFKIPMSFNLPINTALSFELWDDDSPLSDDGCVTDASGNSSNASVGFNIPNTGGWFTATNGGLSIQYHITHSVFSNSCSDTIPIAALPIAPTIQVVAGDSSLCSGETVTLGAFGSSTQNSYQWYKDNTLISGATGLTYVANAGGSYTVAVTNGNLCISESDSQIVTLNPQPTFTVQTTGGSNSITYTLTNVQPANNVYYLWYKNGVQDVNAFGPSYTATTSGTYKVCVIDAITSCQSCQTFSPFTVAIEDQMLSNLQIYPNPATDEVSIQMNLTESREVSISLKDIVGRTILTQNLGNVNGEINHQLGLSAIAKGIYQLVIQTEKGTYSTKLIVQ